MYQAVQLRLRDRKRSRIEQANSFEIRVGAPDLMTYGSKTCSSDEADVSATDDRESQGWHSDVRYCNSVSSRCWEALIQTFPRLLFRGKCKVFSARPDFQHRIRTLTKEVG